MKSIMKRSSVCVTMATMLVTLALVSPVAAKNQVPFHGSILGAEVDHVQGTTHTGVGTGTGIATGPAR